MTVNNLIRELRKIPKDNEITVAAVDKNEFLKALIDALPNDATIIASTVRWQNERSKQ